jgi:hypothetical protein
MPIGVIAAGIGATGAIVGGGISALGAESAAGQQAKAAQSAIAAQQQMFGTAQQALSPYYTAGQSQIPTLQKLLTPGPSQTQTLSQLPGFQFQSQWGNLAATNALAAQGLGGSAGPLAKAISDYNQGLAGTSFSNLVGQEQNFANMGAGAAGALGGLAVQTGQGIGASTQAAGNALASGTLGATNAIAGGLTGAGNSATNALLFNALLNQQPNPSVYGNSNFAGIAGNPAPGQYSY